MVRSQCWPVGCGDENRSSPPLELQIQNIEESLGRMEAWEKTPEGIAEYGRRDRFAAFGNEHEAETNELYSAWLDEQAEQFR
jgi:hypothetical protein